MNKNEGMKVAFYTLGCKVNQYETQVMKENFLGRGFSVVGEEDFADVYVINTCTVTNLADRKSRQYIRRMKRLNENSLIAVTGCYVQVSPEEISCINGVDLIVGNEEKDFLPKYVEERILKHSDKVKEDVYDDPWNYLESSQECFHENKITEMDSRTRAYIKIQNGCNKFCSYCIIPYARGPIRSRGCKEIVEEAHNLLGKGYKELVLTGINTALYAMEAGYAPDDEYADRVRNLKGIEIIVKLLNDISGDFRIRLGSLEPTVIDASLAERLLKYPKLCHHMHLSLQSGSDSILKAMNRNYNREEYLKIAEILRKADEHYGLTTDVIVGFPGEGEEDYGDSKTLVTEVGFLKTHVFPYSERKGTRAVEMEGRIPSSIKKARSSDLIKHSEKVREDFLKSTLGSKRNVLFEEYDDISKMIIGHSDNYIKVYCTLEESQNPKEILNSFANVLFVDIYSDGIKGKIIKSLEK